MSVENFIRFKLYRLSDSSTDLNHIPYVREGGGACVGYVVTTGWVQLLRTTTTPMAAKEEAE